VELAAERARRRPSRLTAVLRPRLLRGNNRAVTFYRMHKAYYLRYDEINAHDIPRQTAFGLAPENIESHRAFRRMKDAIAVPAE
jgi:hypothetical protein